MLFLEEPFKTAWENKDPFSQIQSIKGQIYRKIDTRQTLNFLFNGQSFYIKIHEGTTVKEFLKNIFCLRLPTWGACTEYKAIQRLHEIDVPTMDVAAFGEKGMNPFTRKSFIITRDLNPAISLEDFCKCWTKTPPPYSTKRSIITAVASIVRKMHENGINHRDCYICHFLLKLPYNNEKKPNIFVIDLHRAQIRRSVPERWRNKDIIALYYSVQNIGLTSRDYLLFLKTYFGNKKLKDIFSKEANLFNSLTKKAKQIADRTLRKGL